MNPRGYTILGWAVWKIGSRVARRKLEQNRAKLGAIAVIGAVLVGGVLAAKAESDS